MLQQPGLMAGRLKAKDGKTPDDVLNVVKNLDPDLASSFNIGLADFYPSTSGKEKAAKHIVEHYNTNLSEAFLLCDDDNDMGEHLAVVYLSTGRVC